MCCLSERQNRNSKVNRQPPASWLAPKNLRQVKMKFSLLAAVAAIAPSVLAAPKSKPKSYDGFKVFRVNTHGDTPSVESQLKSVDYEAWEQSPTHIDVLIAPDNLSAFQDLGLDTRLMHQDLGKSIAVEATEPARKWKRQAGDLAWFDSYQNYEDHIEYFNELQRAYPNNSKVIDSGRSYQNRKIFGLHLYGEDGPGKPAVLYHGTVHAREWIAAPVSHALISFAI